LIDHEIRGRLHAARLHLTFLERALAKTDANRELVESIRAADDELRKLEPLVYDLIARNRGDA